jgi:hypothetical protein
LIVVAALVAPSVASAQVAVDDRARWVALAKNGYVVPDGRTAIDVLLEANRLLGSPDPVLRDEVAFGAAERWIRDGKVPPADLRRLLELWMSNTLDGLPPHDAQDASRGPRLRGTDDDERVFKRSFSALCLSLIAARDLTTPFLEAADVGSFFDRMLDYFQRETDLRGFDPVRGWMHTVAHTSDALKFLARNPKLPLRSDVRLLAAVRAKIEAAPTVFAWGENDRLALALQSAVRRPDADPAALTGWLDHWTEQYKTLWAGGPHVNARQFALVENAKQVMRSLHTALAMEAKPTPSGDNARQAVLSALSRMR